MASGSSMVLFSSRRSEDQEIHASLAAVPPKKSRNRPGVPYPDAEVIALSPTTLMAKNKFVCEVCYKGFPREQNLQLHKRGHNLPWKLKQKTTKYEVKRKVYLCPDSSCVHHDPSRALGDLTGIKKHYFRKHGDKKYKCQKCEKMYAVQSDLKAHSKTCGKKEYKCHCGTLFSSRDSFMSHRAFCEALAEGGLIRHPSTVTSIRVSSSKNTYNNSYPGQMSASLPKLGSQVPYSTQNLTHAIPTGVSQLGQTSHMIRPSMGFDCYKPTQSFFEPSANEFKYQGNLGTRFFPNLVNTPHNNMDYYNLRFMGTGKNNGNSEGSSFFSSYTTSMPQLSATALLQKAALIGSTSSNNSATNFLSGSSSSDPVDGTTFGKGRSCFVSSDCNKQGNNMYEFLNSSSSSSHGSTIFNQYGGATNYDQEHSNHGCRDSTSGGYGWINWNSEEHRQQPQNMSFQQSSGGVTFTRDFLGVGGDIVGNISSDMQQCTFGGQSFQ